MTGSLVLGALLILCGPVIGMLMTTLAKRLCSGRIDSSVWFRSALRKVTGRPGNPAPPVSPQPVPKGRDGCETGLARTRWPGALAGLGGAVLAVLAGGAASETLLAAAFLWLLIGLFETDRLCQRLPDVLTAPLLGVGIALGIQHASLFYVALSAAVGAGALWMLAVLYRRHSGRDGLGFGDVKLMAGISAAVGATAIPWVTLVASGLALATSLWRQRRYDPQAAVPFGCYLAIAAALVWTSTATV